MENPQCANPPSTLVTPFHENSKDSAHRVFNFMSEMKTRERLKYMDKFRHLGFASLPFKYMQHVALLH